MITGDGFESDIARREFMVDYIISTFEQHDILFLQEVDNDVCARLSERGVQVVYFEEYLNSSRGGNAICTTRPDVQFSHDEPIWDEWDGGRKLVGTYCMATFGGTSMSLASYHFDKYTSVEITRAYMRHDVSIFGGDFNKDVRQFDSLSSEELSVSRATGDDVHRKITIDGVFECLKH
jgi:hypothetical protein